MNKTFVEWLPHKPVGKLCTGKVAGKNLHNLLELKPLTTSKLDIAPAERKQRAILKWHNRHMLCCSMMHAGSIAILKHKYTWTARSLDI